MTHVMSFDGELFCPDCGRRIALPGCQVIEAGDPRAGHRASWQDDEPELPGLAVFAKFIDGLEL